ncbi:unnamed protein product [Gordionus sp. m RMFG-2023]
MEPDDYKEKYKKLENKIKNLLYEQCIYEAEIVKTEERLLQIHKDNNFLVQRLAELEKNVNYDDECEDTELSSEDEKLIVNYNSKCTVLQKSPKSNKKCFKIQPDLLQSTNIIEDSDDNSLIKQEFA